MMDQSPVVKRALEIINRMSELNEQLAKLIRENGHPKGALPAYVEYTPEQWQEYDRNRAEHKQLESELLNLHRRV
jgi:hypothetical protein